MKIWVVGASGMLGFSVVEALKKQGKNFVGTGSEVDITDRKKLASFAKEQKISEIIHCAAYTKVDLAEEEKERAFQVNVEGTKNLAVVAKELGVHVVFISTDYVFSGEKKTPYTEEDFCFPINVYGESKYLAEKQLLSIKPDSCIVRTSWLFGKNGKNFVSTMIQQMQEKQSLSVVNDQWGAPTYCKDLAEVILLLLETRGVFHFSNAGQTNWHQFAQEIFALAKQKNSFGQKLTHPLICESIHPIATKDFPTKAKRPAYSVLDTNKLQKICTISPRSWQEALKEYMDMDFL
jgi:dTDP-4-dehydrorhamnose reductase